MARLVWPSEWEFIVSTGTLLVTDEAGARLPNGPGATLSWNVSNEIQRPVNRNYPELTAFVIHAPWEELKAESNTECFSLLANPRLVIEYTAIQ